MKNLLTTMAFIYIGLSYAQDSANVLFIGNSYTFYNNLPQMVSELSNSFGDEFTYESQLQGGAMLSTHTGNPATFTAIESQQWDYVVIQAQSQEPSFPDAQVDAQTLPHAIQLADSVYASDVCAEVMFYMTWGRENGDSQWGPISTFEGMNNRLRNAYLRFADTVGGSVSPVGSAWAYVRETYPTIDLYTADESHPSFAGSYLAACTFYASIFRKSPVGSTYIGSLNATDAANLQGAAALTVLHADSLELFNLKPKTELTIADFSWIDQNGLVEFTNESEHAENFYWDFGNNQTSTDDSPNNQYQMGGIYPVTLIAESHCDSDTLEIDIDVSVLGLEEKELLKEIQLKNLGNGHYSFVTNGTPEVLNLSGQKMNVLQKNGNSFEINLEKESKGMYLLYLKGGAKANAIRLMR